MATASSLLVVEELVAAIPVAALSPLETGSVLIANLTETIPETIPALACWEMIFALDKRDNLCTRETTFAL